MSGGHFDYQQYHIEDIANSIEREIEEATKPKPPKVWKEGVTVFKKIDAWHSVGIYKGFKTYDEAVKHLKKTRHISLSVNTKKTRDALPSSWKVKRWLKSGKPNIRSTKMASIIRDTPKKPFRYSRMRLKYSARQQSMHNALIGC